ncbi:MAG TPA: IS4 family transposase [Rhabdochlamydiaceae bacterium]
MSEFTPFLKAFGPLLFGRRAKRRLEKIQKIDQLAELYQVFGDLVPEKFLQPTEKGKGSRARALPLRVTFWAFVSQVMQPKSSCREVVRKVDAWWRWLQKDRMGEAALSPSAYCQARARLEPETLELILAHTAHNLERHVLSEEKGPAGRSVRIIDGTGISMPDTPANQVRFPQSGAQKPGLGFPVAKVVGLFSLGSGALLEYIVGTLRSHDSGFLTRLMEKIRKGDILLADRGFCSYAALAMLLARGADGLMRLHQARRVDFQSAKVLGKDDHLLVWKRPLTCPKGWEKASFEALPKTLTVRIIGLKVEVPGFRSTSITLVTTLTDALLYPADELRELYAKRWNVELHFHQIKIALSMDLLRCQSPEMIEREILIHLITYNLIRSLMQRASHIHHTTLARLSFKGSLDSARHFSSVIHASSSSRAKQEALIAELLAVIASDLIPLRPNRCEPRAKKRRPKNYALLTKPRHEMELPQHRNRWKAQSPKPALS